MNGYDLSRAWFDFAFENTDLVSGNHTGVYLWNVELNNRLGWVKKFSSPASQAMMANGIGSYNTYKKVFDDLVKWGFIEVIQESKNQYTACIIAISNFDKALDKALDKAVTKQLPKQSESTIQSTNESTSSIIKPINQQTNKPRNQETSVDACSVEVESIPGVVVEKKESASPKVARKGSPVKFDPLLVELPFSGSDFIEAWRKWAKYRSEIKKPLTESMVTEQIKKLSGFDEDLSTAFILQTIEKGWQGIFYELKSTYQGYRPEVKKGNIEKNFENIALAEQNILEKRRRIAKEKSWEQ